MKTKKVIANLRKEANAALSKVFDKVEEVSKRSSLQIKIHNLENKIKNVKIKIGNYIVENEDKFQEIKEIKQYTDEIAEINREFVAKKELLQNLKEAEEETEETADTEKTNKEKETK